MQDPKLDPIAGQTIELGEHRCIAPTTNINVKILQVGGGDPNADLGLTNAREHGRVVFGPPDELARGTYGHRPWEVPRVERMAKKPAYQRMTLAAQVSPVPKAVIASV